MLVFLNDVKEKIQTEINKVLPKNLIVTILDCVTTHVYKDDKFITTEKIVVVYSVELFGEYEEMHIYDNTWEDCLNQLKIFVNGLGI